MPKVVPQPNNTHVLKTTHSDEKNLHDAMWVLINFSKTVKGFDELLSKKAHFAAEICEECRDSGGRVFEADSLPAMTPEEHQQLMNEEAPL
jgi:hypothetical protein